MKNELLRLLTDEPKDATKIEDWFDRIAKHLLLQNVFQVNDILLEFTEIEFYFFRDGFHDDEYTHPHDRNVGEWRFHNSGLDITLRSSDVDKQDGGILIRGLKDISKGSNLYINGPRNIITLIGECWNKVTSENKLAITRKELGIKEILKTTRHLPNKSEWKKEENRGYFQNKNYRYITELENNGNLKHIKRENCILL